MEQYIATNANGETLRWDGTAWRPMPRMSPNAPGAGYLRPAAMGDSKSEQAYYRQWRQSDNSSVASARQQRRDALRAEQLMQKQETGGIFAVPGIGKLAGMLDPEIRELEAIQSRVARANRQPGEGAVSDFDAQQFIAMTYGPDKPTETNRNLIRAQRIANDQALQRRYFMEWHFNNFGTLSGAEEAWDRYAQDNPIFAPESPDSLNDKRLNWRQYFGVANTPGDARPTEAAEDIQRAQPPRRGNPSAEQVRGVDQDMRAGRYDRNAELGSRKRPFVAESQAIADRLAADPKNRGRYIRLPNGALGVIE